MLDNKLHLLKDMKIGMYLILLKSKVFKKHSLKFTKVNLNTLVQLNKSYKTTHILTINPNHDYVNEYEKDTKLGYSQNLFNYIVGGTGTIKKLEIYLVY